MMPKKRTDGNAPLAGRDAAPVDSTTSPAESPAAAVETVPGVAGDVSEAALAGGSAAAGDEARPAEEEEAAMAEAVVDVPDEEPPADEPPAGDAPVATAQEAAVPDEVDAVEAEEQAAEAEAARREEDKGATGEAAAAGAQGQAQEGALAVVAAAGADEAEAAPDEPPAHVPAAGEKEEQPTREEHAAVAAAAVAAAQGEGAPDEPLPGADQAVDGEQPAEGEAPPGGGEEEPPAASPVALAATEGKGAATGEGLEHDDGAALALEKKRFRRRLLTLGALVLLLIGSGAILGRYLLWPGPLPDLLPLPVDVNYKPHYLFSIYGVELPVGVAVSADGERIYVAESGGQREVKVLDRDGYFLDSLSPPYTQPAERAPVYLAVDPVGRVYVTDRLQRAVFVYDAGGQMLDALLGPDLTLSEYVSEQAAGLEPDGAVAYNGFGGSVLYQEAGRGAEVFPAPNAAGWAPLGVRLDGQGTMLLTNVAEGQHLVRQFPGEMMLAANWLEFDPPEFTFGTQGQGREQLLFPNTAVADSQGRIYVTDGNNGRISVWDQQGTFLFTFGRGVGEAALSLPRGAAIDGRDRLHVVDAVQQAVKVYDVSGPEPRFVYAFGDWGTGDGQFNFPGDIALDRTGRLYIADRKNSRIQVWSY